MPNMPSVEIKLVCVSGNWVESRRDPTVENPRAPSKPETTAHEAMVESSKAKLSSFGTGLLGLERKYDDRIDYSNPVQYDKEAAPSSWQTVTHGTHGNPGKLQTSIKDFSSTFSMKDTALTRSKPAADNYAARWTKHQKGSASDRFVTETSHAQAIAVPRSFQARLVRRLPGTPKALEVLRVGSLLLFSMFFCSLTKASLCFAPQEKMVQRHGMYVVRDLAKVFNKADDSRDGVLSKVGETSFLVTLSTLLPNHASGGVRGLVENYGYQAIR